MARRVLIITLVAAFSLGTANLGISGGMGKKGKEAGSAMGKETLPGTVTRVDGNTVTLRDAGCKEQTVEVTNPKELKDIRIGDHVSVWDGRIVKANTGVLLGYGIRPLPFPGETC